jgi:hypothetical protein
MTTPTLIIRIRNKRVLRWLGFEPQPGAKDVFASLTLRTWLEMLWRRISQ